MNLFVLLGKNSLKHGNFHNTLRDNRVKENGSEVARSCLISLQSHWWSRRFARVTKSPLKREKLK